MSDAGANGRSWRGRSGTPALLAEFDSPEKIIDATVTLQAHGYVRIEAFTPHAMPELEEKLGIPRSWAPRIVFAGGALGAAFAFLLQWWLNGVNYPLNVGGRPLFSAPAFIPIAFETTVLFASITAFVTWLAVSRLPTLNQSILSVEGFTSVSVDRFWLAIAVSDPRFDPMLTTAQLREAGALQVLLTAEAER